MVFGSLDECVAYIRSCMGVASSQMANRTMIEGRKITQGQLKGYSARPSIYKYPFQGSTGMTAASITITSESSSGMSVEFLDRGGWYSVMTGQHFWAIEGLEGGSTWGRPKTHIMEIWRGWAFANLDNLFLSYMRSQGVPIS